MRTFPGWRGVVPWLLLVICLAGPLATDHLLGAAQADEESPAVGGSQRGADGEDEYELQKMFVDTLEHIERDYVKEVSRRQLIEAAIRGMLSELDPYSSYIDAEHLGQFRSSVEAKFGGIGIRVGMEGGRLQVISPLYDTPAYRAGWLAGDVIIEIDGQSTKGRSIDEASRKLRGEPGTTVRLKVLHPHANEPEEVEITRAVIRVPTVVGYRRASDGRWDYYLDTAQRIGYIRITAFSRNTADDLRQVLRQLTDEGLAALVLDLRFNPGGLLRAAIQVSDLFVDQGVIVSTKGRNVPETTWKAHKEGTYNDFPMVVLVNRYSASASEIVAACLQDHKRAVIVGERTWGKGSVQNLIPLSDNHSALKLTTASYYRPSGENIHRFPGATEKDQWGVRPDDGYRVRLSSRELVMLLEDQRRRERITPPEEKEKDSSSHVASAGRPSDETGQSEPAPAESGDEKPSASGPPEEAGKQAAGAGFEDRQLAAALGYLNNQLAKAEQPGEGCAEKHPEEKDRASAKQSSGQQPAADQDADRPESSDSHQTKERPACQAEEGQPAEQPANPQAGEPPAAGKVPTKGANSEPSSTDRLGKPPVDNQPAERTSADR